MKIYQDDFELSSELTDWISLRKSELLALMLSFYQDIDPCVETWAGYYSYIPEILATTQEKRVRVDGGIKEYLYLHNLKSNNEHLLLFGIEVDEYLVVLLFMTTNQKKFIQELRLIYDLDQQKLN